MNSYIKFFAIRKLPYENEIGLYKNYNLYATLADVPHRIFSKIIN